MVSSYVDSYILTTCTVHLRARMSANLKPTLFRAITSELQILITILIIVSLLQESLFLHKINVYVLTM